MNKQDYRLPRQIESDPRAAAIKAALASRQQLWSGARNEAVSLPFVMPMIRAMQLEHKKGRLVRSLELIERALAAQAKGLQKVEEKSGIAGGKRISRLLIIANDCSERYLRKVDNLLDQHRERVLPLMVDADSERLGQLFFGEGKTVKLLLIEHKESVAAVLFALLTKD